MKIYTKRGDNKETDLFGGERVLKNHVRVRAYGEIDCAMTAIGVAHSCPDLDAEIKQKLEYIMKLLFCAGSEVASSEKESAKKLLTGKLKNRIEEQHVQWIESLIDQVDEELPTLSNFILPAGSESATRLHFARNTVRRAEIALVELLEQGYECRGEILRFFNRLSDLFFVLARRANHSAGVLEVIWSGRLDPLA